MIILAATPIGNLKDASVRLVEALSTATMVAAEDDPALAVPHVADVAAGHDLQLERSVEIVMQQLKEHPPQQHPRPAYPSYHEHDDLGNGAQK